MLLALLIAFSLDDADAALAAGDATRCGELAQAALALGDLDEKNVARAWTIRGRCFALAGDVDRAERSYAVAIRVDRSIAVDDDDAFKAALRALPEIAIRANARAEQLNVAKMDGSDEQIDRVVVTLSDDDLQLVKSASLVRGDDEIARFPLLIGAAKHVVTGVPIEGIVLLLHDKHGNVLARTDVAAPERAVEHTAEASPPRTPTALTTVGASAIGLGLAGAIASGIGVAASSQGEDQLWLVGVGASTGVFLVGAALVVVDQGF